MIIAVIEMNIEREAALCGQGTGGCGQDTGKRGSDIEGHENIGESGCAKAHENGANDERAEWSKEIKEQK